MEITEEMYILAKTVVIKYENKQHSVKPLPMRKSYVKSALELQIDEIFNADNYNNPFKDGIIMPCCGQKYAFSYATMKYMHKNPDLKYKEFDSTGDIIYDANSREPSYVDYNNCREAIRQAKSKGLSHIHWKTSVFTSEEIRRDGYIDHNDGLDTISW